MEHVNNDMDNLFRKAGELYPLKTSESDWDGVLGKLQDEISGEKGIPYGGTAKGNSNRRRWLLLLLIPAFIVSLVYFSGSRVTGKKSQSAINVKGLPANKNYPDAHESSSAPGQANTKNIENPEPKLNSASGVVATVPGPPTENRSFRQAVRTPGQKVPSGSTGNGTIDAISRSNTGNRTASDQTNNLTDPESFHEPVEKAVHLSVYGLSEKPSVYGMPFPPLVLKEVTLNPVTAGSVAKTKTNKAAASKGIYAVLLGGPDLSTVAFQSTEQAGYSVGILLGYRFNKRLAIETGLLWDKKNYYSSGEYFDKSKTTISDNVDILNLEGYCNMFEIPLNFRYDFATGINHGFFAAAGFSSYLMKKEYYNYTFKVNNPSMWPYSGGTYGKPYYNNNNYFLSIFQLSAGYEYAIGANTKIRIEPYLKIPLQGIGIGNMSISSAGLYFGISHSFR